MAGHRIREQQKEILMKAGTGIAMLLICYTGIIQPAFSTIQEYKQNIQDAQSRIELFRDIQVLERNVSTLEDSLVTLQGRSMILKKLNEFAAQDKLDIQSLTPKTISEQDYTKWMIEVDAQGTFFSIVKFFQNLEKMKPVVKCNSVSVLRQRYERRAKRQSVSSPNLQIHLELETRFKKWKKTKK